MHDLHITIPNNNKCSLLREALAALPAAASHITLDVTVVDNMSTDGSADMVEREFPGVRLIRQTEMHGSSANFNAGMCHATARYLCILHEDARPSPEALDHLVQFLDDNPQVGGVSPLIRFPDGTLDRTAGRFPAISDNLLRQLGPFRRLLVYREYHEEVARPFTVDCCSATCLIFRREALQDSGLFDENFVIFYEEIDLFRRLAGRGWETWFVPGAVVIHSGGVTRPHLRRSSDEELRARAIAKHFQRSKYLWFRKHKGYLGEGIVRATDAVVALLKLLVLSILWTVHPSSRHASGARIAAQRRLLREASMNWPKRDHNLEGPLASGSVI